MSGREPAPRSPVALVVAKAPVAGRVKTRLGATVGMEAAAEVAAASLLDTLAACAAAFGTGRCHLALEGDLDEAVRGAEIRAALAGWSVHPQRGAGLAQRLLHAHLDAHAAAGAPTVQVGMDTPQLSAESLTLVASSIRSADDAVLGPASDGGWWLLAVAGPHLLEHLAEVPMSTERTGRETERALERAGARVEHTDALTDVDDETDADLVASQAPQTRFATTWAALRREGTGEPPLDPPHEVSA
jgi:uncharacterized protein